MMMQSDHEWFRLLVMAVLFFGNNGRWYSKKCLVGEIERNNQHDAPSDRQARWHLQHMREDLYVIATSLHVLTLLAIGCAVWHW
jgi:hypothetical protein